jgi:putative transcriptional regulator
MIKVKLQDLLDREERSLSWVALKTNIAYTTLHKFSNNKTSGVSYNVLEGLCGLFKCKIEDIIEYDEQPLNIKIKRGDKVIHEYNKKD